MTSLVHHQHHRSTLGRYLCLRGFTLAKARHKLRNTHRKATLWGKLEKLICLFGSRDLSVSFCFLMSSSWCECLGPHTSLYRKWNRCCASCSHVRRSYRSLEGSERQMKFWELPRTGRSCHWEAHIQPGYLDTHFLKGWRFLWAPISVLNLFHHPDF